MTDYKTLLGIFTIVLGSVSYSFYFRNIFRGKTKPDPFSWLIWGVLASITFVAQHARGGGAGAWATLFTAVVCLIIAALAYIRIPSRMKLIDGLSLCGAFVGIVLWRYTENPLWAVVLAVMVGAMGFIPVFKKAIQKPNEETAITYFLNAFKFAFALLALQSFNLVTWLYPAALTLMNFSLAGLLVLRRRLASRL